MSDEPLEVPQLMKSEEKVLGERKRGKLPANAKFSTEFLEVATRLVAAGMTEAQVGFFLGVTPAKVKQFKRKHPLFKKACEDGKQLAKSYLIAQGLRAAAGYDYVEKNVKIKKKVLDDGTIVEYPAEVSEFHKHQKPDAALLVFILSNMSRQCKDEVPWLSQHKIEVKDEKTLNIKIQGKVATEQISRLAGAFMPKEIEAEFIDETTKHSDGKPKRLTGGNTKRRRGKHTVEDETSQEDG
jgi:hypothetical protein